MCSGTQTLICLLGRALPPRFIPQPPVATRYSARYVGTRTRSLAFRRLKFIFCTNTELTHYLEKYIQTPIIRTNPPISRDRLNTRQNKYIILLSRLCTRFV